MYLLVLFCVLIVGMCATYLHEIRYVCTLYIYVPGTPSTEPGIHSRKGISYVTLIVLHTLLPQSLVSY